MPFDRERAYYEQHKEDLLRHHEGKFVLIVGEDLVGSFDAQGAAYEAGIAKYGNVPLFIKLVQRDEPKVSIPAMTLGFIGARS